MSILSAVIQGIIQGLTEFLPVSSSGHLSLYQHFSGQSGEGSLLFSAVLHMGTLIAVFIVFRERIFQMTRETALILKNIFTGRFSYRSLSANGRGVVMIVLSLLMLLPFYIFRDIFESVSEDSDIIVEGICFIYTAALLFMTDRCDNNHRTMGDITPGNAVTVGLFQGLALLPGISRSGSTIAGGTFCGFDRDTAVEYSFILGIPAILGGCLLEGKKALETGTAMNTDPICTVVGFATSAIVGVLAIRLVKLISKGRKFKIFGVYTLILGVGTIITGITEII